MGGADDYYGNIARFASESPSFVALFAGLVWVLLGDPYVGLTPEMPIFPVLMVSFSLGLFAYAMDLSGTFQNEWTIRETTSLGVLLLAPSLYWSYSNKFLGMSASYLTDMSRDITVLGSQMNLSFYPMEKLALLFGGFILICFLLVQNEFSNFPKVLRASFSRYASKPPPVLVSESGIKDRIDPITGVKVSEYSQDAEYATLEMEGESGGDSTDRAANAIGWSSISTSLFGIGAFVVSYVLLTSVLELSPGSQVPFVFLGGAMVAGVLLLQNNIHEILAIRSHNFRQYAELSPKSISAAVSVLAIILFVIVTLNMPMFPFISNDIPAFLSMVTLIVAILWSYILTREGAKPKIQSHRTAALVFFALFPFVSYLLLRLVFLQNDGTDPTMLNRWEVRYDFMDKGNTFRINPWPLEAEPNIDARWVFLKAAVINSTRATLVSIFLCTVLGIIVGVARLSRNKLTSATATVYVEVFRNLPLAVLLFLIATQIGLQFPMFIEEKSYLGGAIYYSNEGIWFATVASYAALALSILSLALLRVYLRFRDRVAPRKPNSPQSFSGRIRRPFSSLDWKMEALAADLLVVSAFALLIARVHIGEAIFGEDLDKDGLIDAVRWIPVTLYDAMFTPFLSTPTNFEGKNMQTISHNAKIAVGPLLSTALVVYSLYITTSIDDDGMNELEIDDSEEGVRARFTLWVAALAIAAGFTLAGGMVSVGEALSVPEYTKDWNNCILPGSPLECGDGVIDSPGSWDISTGTGFEITPFFLAMVLGLTLFTASVVAEIVRGSIQSLPRGQVEAAISLSLNPYQRLRLVILPQALRSMVPLLNNQFMNVWKNSSLAVVVAYTDIFYVILVMMNNVGKLIPLFLLLLVTYQAGSLTISAVMNWYNSRVTSVKI